MASGVITGTTSNSYIASKIEWSSTIDVANNQSTVTAKLYYRRTNSYSGTATGGTGTVSISIDGQSGSSTVTLTVPNNGSWVHALTVTKIVKHTANGSKSITISASGGFPPSSLSSTSCSKTVPLDTIPRASSIDSLTCSTNYLDGTFTYKYTPQSNVLYNRLRVSIPSVVKLADINLGTKTASQQTGTYTLTPALLVDIYNRYTNSDTCQIGFVIETYSNNTYSTKVGESKELTLTMTFPSSIAPDIRDIIWTKTSNEPSTWPITQSVTRGVMSMTGVTGIYGSTIETYSLTFAGLSSTSSSLDVSNIAYPGELTAIAKVVDSRGRSASKEVKVVVAEYKKPQLTVSVYRSNVSGIEDDSGEYMYVKASASVTAVGDNALQSLLFQYKRHTDSVYTSVFLEPNIAKVVEASSDYTWDWIVTATDMVYPVSDNNSISTGDVVLDISADGKSIAFQKVAEHKNAFEVANPMTVGPIVGMNQLVRILASSNINDYKTPGCYGVFTHGDAGAILNLPSDKAGILRVYSATGDGNTRGQYAYVIQEYHPMYADVFYKRLIYTSDVSEVWYYGGWYSYHATPV